MKLKNTSLLKDKCYINGKWIGGKEVIEVTNPATGKRVGTVPRLGKKETADAIKGANKAWPAWKGLTAKERAAILRKWFALINDNADDLALIMTSEQGKPLAEAKGEVAYAASFVEWFAEEAKRVYGDTIPAPQTSQRIVVTKEPIGVCAAITPWNFPFLIVGQKLPFALAAGCTAVVKPSELTSGSTLLLGEILAEAGVPDGVVNIITGTGSDVGQHMSTHPDVDMVSFTGSTGVGKLTMANAAQTLKKVSLELGGKNPQILFPDADMDAFIDAAVFGAWFNAGECCNAGSRLIVHRSIVDEIVGRVADLSKKVIVGDPLDVSTQVGAIITPQHLSKVGAYVDQAKKAGAAIAHGGDVLDLGLGQYMGPTIIAGVKADMAVAREEVFGPVLSVLSFDTVDEAISIANAVDYGLSAGVWSRDFDTCMSIGRKVRAGTVWMNTFMDGTPELPFGGYRQSGLGRELGRHAVEDYTETKTLNMHIGARTGWWMPQAK